MKFLIKYAKLIGIFMTLIFFFSFINGLLNLFGISYQISSILNIFFMIVVFLVFGIIEGMNAYKKGFLEGLKLGLIFLGIMLIIDLILFSSTFALSKFIYYFILLFTCVLGAMIGINRKKKE